MLKKVFPILALSVDEGRSLGMGSTMSIFFLAQGSSMAIGPIISGGIHDALDVNRVFYFGATMSGIGTFLFVWLTQGYHR